MSGRWRAAALVVAALVLVVGGTTALVLSGSSQGSAATDRAKAAAAPGLADLEAAAARDGETVAVSWSVVQDPRGNDVHQVTARLELQPSGQVSSAAFVVSGDRVEPQDALARRLIGEPAAG
jgi:hypothetical protein